MTTNGGGLQPVDHIKILEDLLEETKQARHRVQEVLGLLDGLTHKIAAVVGDDPRIPDQVARTLFEDMDVEGTSPQEYRFTFKEWVGDASEQHFDK